MVEEIYENLLRSASESRYMGIDPYDFASTVLPVPSALKSKISFINKVSPINFRGCLGIGESNNSKSNALFLNALALNLEDHKSEADYLKKWLLDNKSPEFDNYSIGFSFDMALDRYESGPGKSSLIITLFACFAFLELYRNTKDPEIKAVLNSAYRLIKEEWPKYHSDAGIWYSYLPGKVDEVYNATAKVGRFFSEMHKEFPELGADEELARIVDYLCDKQFDDGSWGYSVKSPYVDGFHTAFVLESLYEMLSLLPEHERGRDAYEKGLADYKVNLMDGARPLHFHKSRGPKDIRNKIIKTEVRDAACAVILFSKIGDLVSAEKTLRWVIDNFYDRSRGYFYFYDNSIYSSKINYIRWQAWMAFAIGVYMSRSGK